MISDGQSDLLAWHVSGFKGFLSGMPRKFMFLKIMEKVDVEQASAACLSLRAL